LPTPDASFRLAGLAHDGVRVDALDVQQHDLRPPYVLLRRVPVFDQSVKPIKIGLSGGESDVSSHPTASHDANSTGIPCRTQLLGAIHSAHGRLVPFTKIVQVGFQVMVTGYLVQPYPEPAALQVGVLDCKFPTEIDPKICVLAKVVIGLHINLSKTLQASLYIKNIM